MKINSINTNYNNARKNNVSNNPNFSGSLQLKGWWPGKTEDLFVKHPAVQKALKKYSVTAEMKEKPEKIYKIIEGVNKCVAIPRLTFRLNVSLKKDNPTFWDKVKYKLGMQPKKYLSKYYHSVDTTENYLIQRLNAIFYHLTKGEN